MQNHHATKPLTEVRDRIKCAYFKCNPGSASVLLYKRDKAERKGGKRGRDGSGEQARKKRKEATAARRSKNGGTREAKDNTQQDDRTKTTTNQTEPKPRPARRHTKRPPHKQGPRQAQSGPNKTSQTKRRRQRRQDRQDKTDGRRRDDKNQNPYQTQGPDNARNERPREAQAQRAHRNQTPGTPPARAPTTPWS